MFRKILFVVIYHLGSLDDLMHSEVWVNPNIKFTNLCKPIFFAMVIPGSFDPLNLETGMERKEDYNKIEHLESKKSFLDEITSIFPKIESTSFKGIFVAILI